MAGVGGWCAVNAYRAAVISRVDTCVSMARAALDIAEAAAWRAADARADLDGAADLDGRRVAAGRLASDVADAVDLRARAEAWVAMAHGAVLDARAALAPEEVERILGSIRVASRE
jgi:hypothetical protein